MFVSSDCFKGREAEYRALMCGIRLIGKVKRVAVVNMNLVVLMHKFNQCYCQLCQVISNTFPQYFIRDIVLCRLQLCDYVMT